MALPDIHTYFVALIWPRAHETKTALFPLATKYHNETTQQLINFSPNTETANSCLLKCDIITVSFGLKMNLITVAWHCWQIPPPPVVNPELTLHQVDFCCAYSCQPQEQNRSHYYALSEVMGVNWPSSTLLTKPLAGCTPPNSAKAAILLAPKDLHKVITFRGKEPMMGKRRLLKWTMSRKGPSYLP